MRTILLAIALLAAAESTFAATCTWTGLGANSNWSTSANWNNCGGAHALPADGDVLVFPAGAPRLTSTNDLSKLLAAQLQINGSLNVSGNALKLTAGIAANVLGAQTPPLVGIDVSLDDAQTFSCFGDQPIQLTGTVSLLGQQLTINGGCSTTIAGSLVGTGSLTQNGPATLFLTATNVYSGPTTINGGFITTSRDFAFGANGVGNETTINAGSTLGLVDGPVIGEDLFLAGEGAPSPFTIGALATDSSALVTGNLTLTADATINTFGPGSQLTLSGNVGGAFELTKIGEGTLHWLGTGQLTQTIVGSGTLDLAGSATDVLAGATLAGGGECTGAVTLTQFGTLAPGPLRTSTPGTLSAASLTWTAGAHFAWQLGATSAASDHVSVGGNLARSSTGAFEFQFSDASRPPAVGVTYTLLAFAQSTGFSQGDFTFSYAGTGPGSSMSGTFALTPGELQFTPSSVQSDLVFRADLDG